MERSRLLELAPDYYTIAICNYFSKPANSVASTHTVWGNGGIKNWPLFTHVFKTLVQKGMLKKDEDDFGPTIYIRTDKFEPEWAALKKREGTPYSRFSLDPQREVWLNAALENVNKALEEQKITAKDLEKPEAEWEPIPVDRADPRLQLVTSELDKTIAAVEADNGYNATLPEEKAFVVDSLKSANEKLKKDDAVSYGYLKRKAIDVLDVLVRRFGKASVGLAAQAARAAIFEWLKGLGADILHWLF